MKQMFPVFWQLSTGNFFLLTYINYLYNRMLLYILSLVVMFPDCVEVFLVVITVKLVQSGTLGRIYL